MKNPEAMAKAILKLYQNPDLKKRMAKNAKERIANRFTQERTIDQLVELYEEFLNSKS